MRVFQRPRGKRFLPAGNNSSQSIAIDDFLPRLNALYLWPLKERVPESVPPANDGAAEEQPEAGQARSILIVDDSQFERTVIRSAVEGLTTFRVCGEAADGADGIKKAVELKPDLVIMDLAMPLMNGVEASMVMRNTMPKVPIVLLTLYAEQLRGAISPGFGVTIILSKADGLAPLLECLERLLGT
jgi:CheY-like chemotaxis protein